MVGLAVTTCKCICLLIKITQLSFHPLNPKEKENKCSI